MPLGKTSKRQNGFYIYIGQFIKCFVSTIYMEYDLEIGGGFTPRMFWYF